VAFQPRNAPGPPHDGGARQCLACGPFRGVSTRQATVDDDPTLIDEVATLLPRSLAHRVDKVISISRSCDFERGHAAA
jgi:hypothetical protein